MPKAASKIEHGFVDKNGKNKTLVFNVGEDVKGIPPDVLAGLVACGAVIADESGAATQKLDVIVDESIPATQNLDEK